VLSLAVQLRYGRFAATVLIGWGCSMIVCLAYVVASWLRLATPLPAEEAWAAAPKPHRPMTA
jgi:hypothetical protein